MPRTIRERPRYALLLGLGLTCLVGLGLLAGLLLAGGDESTDPGPDSGAGAEARELRATRAELADAQAELEMLRTDVDGATARQRARAASWRRRALRLERRNRALRRALTQARQQE